MTYLDDAKQHALEAYPSESCGLVVAVGKRKKKQKYVRCTNLAGKGDRHFVIGAEDYAAAEDMGEVVGVIHSHPDETARPSPADKVCCETTELPWTIISVMPGPVVAEVKQIVPTGVEFPLVGRVFVHGVLDCYTLVKDWYKRERDIDLPDFERHDEWWNDGHSNLYLDHFKEAGFESVGQYPELEVGDVLLLEIRSDNQVPNHAAVYIGDGQILQHLYGRLSAPEVYGGYWREVTRLVVRRPK